jgi:hypothetical protein
VAAARAAVRDMLQDHQDKIIALKVQVFGESTSDRSGA